MKNAAPATAQTTQQERETPAFRERLQFVGQQCNDYTLTAPDSMTIEDLTDPAAWALAKQVVGGPALNVGDSVRVIHRDWIATVIVDQAGRNEPCHVLVQSTMKRSRYAKSQRGLIPADHDVEQDAVTGFFKAVFFRGKGKERVELGEYSDFDRAAQATREHATRVAPGR